MNKDKIYKILTFILNGFMIIFTIFIIAHFLKVKDYSRIPTDVMLYMTIFIPWIFEKTKYKMNAEYKFIYCIFIFLAQFLGSIINLYKYITWFDLFAHFLSGVFAVVVANYILERSKYKNISGLIKFIYIIGFSSFVAVIWEIIEFSGDVFFKMNLQHNIETGVFDTMEDIIVAVIGALIAYIIDKQIKKTNM